MLHINLLYKLLDTTNFEVCKASAYLQLRIKTQSNTLNMIIISKYDHLLIKNIFATRKLWKENIAITNSCISFNYIRNVNLHNYVKVFYDFCSLYIDDIKLQKKNLNQPYTYNIYICSFVRLYKGHVT